VGDDDRSRIARRSPVSDPPVFVMGLYICDIGVKRQARNMSRFEVLL
jgi:hypothetical protein